MEDKDLLIEQLKQRIRELENQLIQKKKSGNRSSRNGKEYEIEIHRVLQNVMIVFTKMNRIKIIPFHTQHEKELGGSSSKTDIVCQLDDIHRIGIEVKNNIHCEFIQLDIHPIGNNKWTGPLRTTKNSHPETVIQRYLLELENNKMTLFDGDLPPLKKSRQEFDTWQKKFLEKHKTKDYTWECQTENFIQLNYREKGNHYIQIRDYGLFHLGEDVCHFGCPEFKPKKTFIRIRCKRRGGSQSAPSSITMSAFIKKPFEKSKFSLDHCKRLPKNLIKLIVS